MIIGISSLVALAGIITAIILIVNANKHKNDPQTSAWHEVKFAMPAGLSEEDKANVELPDTLMVEQGVTVAQLPIAKCKGQMFLGWYYDDSYKTVTASSDIIDHNMTLYPRFGSKDGLDGVFSYDYVAKMDVDKNYEVLVVTHKNLSKDQIAKLISLRNLSTCEEDIPFTLEEYKGNAGDIFTGDKSYTPDDMTRELLLKVSIDPNCDTLPDLYALYGLEKTDSVERYWREVCMFDPDKVSILSDAVEKLRMREWNNGKIYVLRPASGTWKEGCFWQAELLDTEYLRYAFEGAETEKQIVYNNFTVDKKEFNDVAVSDEVIYIPYAQVQGIPELRSVFTLIADDDQEVVNNDRSGVLTVYRELTKGTVIAVYEGTLKDDGTVDGDIGYYRITEVLGDNKYAYDGATILDIIKKPVSIPVQVRADISGGTLTLTPAELDFSSPLHEKLGLKKGAGVKEGDILVFYEGTLPVDTAALTASTKGLGKITSITTENDIVTVTYEKTTAEQTQRSQGMFKKVSNVEMPVSEADAGAMRENMQKQLEASGFVDVTGNYIVGLINGDAVLPDDPEMADALKNLKFQTDTGDEIAVEELRALAAGSKVEFSGLSIDFTLSPKLEHFSGKGIRAVFSAGFAIKIKLNGDNIIEIKVGARLEQEVLLGYNFSLEIEWAGIIPTDATIDAGLQAGTFTCLGASATVMTKTDEKDTDWANLLKTTGADGNPNPKTGDFMVNLGKRIKMISDGFETVQGGGTYTKQKGEDGKIGANKDADAAAEGSLGGDLPTKYAAMLENDAEYIPIINQELLKFEFHIDPWHVVAVSLRANLVVKFKLNAMIGFSVSYGNAKQYTYHVSVAEGEVQKKVGDLETPNFRVDFFTFGMVGLRAGVLLDFRIGLLSTDLDSVGITAEVGLYAEFYGFIYMFYEWKSGEKPNSGIMGSLLFELGAYLEINFKAQIGDDAVKKEIKLYEKTWPLLTLGAKEVPVPHPNNGVDDAELYETLEFDEGRNTVKVPDAVFDVYMMSLKDGSLSTKSQDTSKKGTENYRFTINTREYIQYNEEHFVVTCVDLDGENGKSNGKHSFQYLPATNEVYVKPVDDDKEELWGEISFVYRNNSFGFTTVEIRRTLKVHWKGVRATAAVEYYVQNDDGTYDYVKTGGFDGWDGIEYDLKISPEFAKQYDDYYLTGIDYPGIMDLQSVVLAAEKEMEEAVEKYRKGEMRAKDYDAAIKKYKQILKNYNEYYENIVTTLENSDGVMYFLMVKNETVVRLYFDKLPKHEIHPMIVYDKPVTDNNKITQGLITKRSGEKIYDELQKVGKEFIKISPSLSGIDWYSVPCDVIKTYPKVTYTDENGNIVSSYTKVHSYKGAINVYLPVYTWPDDKQLSEILADDKDWTLVTEDYVVPDEGVIFIGHARDGATVTVTWQDEYENIIREDTVVYGEPVPAKPEITHPPMSGYVYTLNWYDENGYINSFGRAYGNKVYTAKWTPVAQYQNITWVTDEKTWTTQGVETGKPIGNLESPSLEKTGYNYKLYIVRGNVETDVDPEAPMPGGGITVRVEYIKKTIEVKWMDKGEIIKEETVPYGSKLTAPSVQVAEGEGLKWLLDNGYPLSATTVADRDVIYVTASRHMHNWLDNYIAGYRKATCNSDGYMRHPCTVCGLIKEEHLDIDPNAHEFDTLSVDKADCVTPEISHIRCRICGKTEDIQTGRPDPNNHKAGELVLRAGFAATCGGDGRTDMYLCPHCGQIISGGETIPATGQHRFDYVEITKQPTCTEEGIRTITCSQCWIAEKTETIPALGHTWGTPVYTWSDDHKSVTAKVVCTRDPSHVITETTTNITYKITKETSCTADGTGEYTAVFKSEQFGTVKTTVAIPAIAHVWGEPVYTWSADNSTVTATRYCKYDTNHTHAETETVATESVTTVEPTLQQDGTRVYTATFTNSVFKKQTKTVAIPKGTGHVHNWVKNDAYVDTAGTYATLDANGKYVNLLDPTKKFTLRVKKEQYKCECGETKLVDIQLTPQLSTYEFDFIWLNDKAGKVSDILKELNAVYLAHVDRNNAVSGVESPEGLAVPLKVDGTFSFASGTSTAITSKTYAQLLSDMRKNGESAKFINVVFTPADTDAFKSFTVEIGFADKNSRDFHHMHSEDPAAYAGHTTRDNGIKYNGDTWTHIIYEICDICGDDSRMHYERILPHVESIWEDPDNPDNARQLAYQETVNLEVSMNWIYNHVEGAQIKSLVEKSGSYVQPIWMQLFRVYYAGENSEGPRDPISSYCNFEYIGNLSDEVLNTYFSTMTEDIVVPFKFSCSLPYYKDVNINIVIKK